MGDSLFYRRTSRDLRFQRSLVANNYSYDAIRIIAEAYKAGATRETLIEKVKSMTFKDMLVVSPEVTFDKNGDRNEKSMITVKVKDGKFVSGGMAIDISNVKFDVP